MRKKMLLQKLSLPILLICNGCGPKGPAVTDCISNPKALQLRCYDYTQGRALIKNFAEVDGWVCLNAVDEKNLLMSCAGKAKGPNVNLCIVDVGSGQFDCYNQLTQMGNHIPFSSTENYTCVSASDYQSILTFCANYKAGKI